MALAKAEQQKLSASDVLSLNDAEFDQVLRDILPAGRTDVTYIALQGWAELPKPDQLRVMQRIECVRPRPFFPESNP
jgi:hypothetical protein